MFGRLIRNIGVLILMIGFCMADSESLIFPLAFIATGALLTAIGMNWEVGE